MSSDRVPKGKEVHLYFDDTGNRQPDRMQTEV